MLDMLKERKAALEAQGKKGFTLMEMLIVIAIIAILIAIAIPIFSAQLENARDATSVANIRSAYAEAQTAFITKQSGGDVTYAPVTGGGATVTVTNVAIPSADSNDWSGVADNLPFPSTLITDAALQKNDATVAFTYNVNGEITAVSIS